MTDRYIETSEQLRELCDQARRNGRIGLDLEFLRERRYYPQLALMQLAVGERTALVDPLIDIDLSPVEELILDPAVTKVFHAATQDLEIFFLRLEQVPRNIFDTQVAAAMLGLGAQISLAGLVGLLFDVDVPKGAGFTDWLRRPLTDRQEVYALADVEHLLPMHDELTRRLEALDRSEWLTGELRRFETESLYRQDPDVLYRKVKRFRSLSRSDRKVLRELAIWREEEAQRRDRPRRSVAADEVLVELSRSKPQSRSDLDHVRGLNAGVVRRSADELLAAVRRGASKDARALDDGVARPPPEPAAQLAAGLVGAFMKAYSASVEIDSGMIARSDEIQDLVIAHLDGEVDAAEFEMLQGWRGDLVGGKVLAFLRGDLSISLDPATAAPRIRTETD